MNETPPRRSPRDWGVDAGLFLLATAFWLLAAGSDLQASVLPESALIQVTGALGCAALWLRRRWPVGVAVAEAAFGIFSDLAAVALVVALFTVAVHRPPRTTALVFAVNLLAPLSHVVMRPSDVSPLLFGVAVQSGVVGWAFSSATGASSSCRCGTGPSGPRPRRGCGPSRSSTGPARRSPGRCTMCSATGCRC